MNSNNQSKGEWHPLFFHHAVSCTGCARDIACVLNHTKKSQVLRHFPVARYTGGFLRFFHTFPCLHSVRPKSAFELFHNALPGQCNRKSGHYIEERRKMRHAAGSFTKNRRHAGYSRMFQAAHPTPTIFPFLARQTRKRPEREGGKPSMGEQSPGSWLPSWDQSRA